MQMVVRLFLEVLDASEAEAVVQGLKAHLQPSGTVCTEVVRPYWKISEYTEVLLAFDLQLSPAAAILAATAYLGEGWTIVSECEAMWTNEGGTRAKVASLRWGHVEVCA